MYLMYLVLFKFLNGVHTQSCQLFATPWTIACQAPLSVEFSQARIMEWIVIPTPGDLPDPGINPHLLHLLHGQAGSLPLVAPEKPSFLITLCYFVELRTSFYL